MKEIKKILFASDIHIKTNKDHQRHKYVLTKFISDCAEIVSQYDKEECRILLLGDIIDNKLDASHELYEIVSWFYRELNNICDVILINGNHDVNVRNFSKKTINHVLTKSMALPNFRNFDLELDYKSGIIVDNNIAFCVYSIFEDYKRPDIELHKIEHNSNNTLKYVGLFHGALKHSSVDSGYSISEGIDVDRFVGNSITLAGDIHKRSEIPYEGGVFIYPSSLLQSNLGENVSGHGYGILDVETLEYEFVDIENPYSFYKFKINSVEDIDNGTESFVNF